MTPTCLQNEEVSEGQGVAGGRGGIFNHISKGWDREEQTGATETEIPEERGGRTAGTQVA